MSQNQRMIRFRVELFDMDANRGPGNIVAIIDDANDVGVSRYANEAGEAFFTLPYNHPSASRIEPLQTHYRVTRYIADAGAGEYYTTIGRGIIDDFEADADEIVFYGTDYMGLLSTTITSSTTSYSAATLGSIFTDQLSAAIAEGNSRMAFTSIGTIDTTSITTTLISAHEPRLQFLNSVSQISMGDRSVRSVLSIARDAPYEWTFEENAGQDREAIRLEWGGTVNGFRYAPGFADLATTIKSVGIKREGAAVLYSTQSYASAATYGYIARSVLHQNVVDQTALDNLTKRDARRAGNPDRRVALNVRSGRLVPWDGWGLGDNMRVVVRRGDLVNINGLYTVWGMEWIASQNGKEDLFLDLTSKET